MFTPLPPNTDHSWFRNLEGVDNSSSSFALSPSSPHHHRPPKITASIAKGAFLALLLTFITAAYATSCAKPRVRREWRSISEAEREEWIAAVKVGCGGQSNALGGR